MNATILYPRTGYTTDIPIVEVFVQFEGKIYCSSSKQDVTIRGGLLTKPDSFGDSPILVHFAFNMGGPPNRN